MKQLKKDFQTVSKSLKVLTQKVEKLKKRLEVLGGKPAAAAAKAKPKISKAKTTKKKAMVKSTPKKANIPTAYDTFLGIVNKSKKGVSVEQLKAKTGFNDKKIANLVFKAKKQRKIKSEDRGIYVKA